MGKLRRWLAARLVAEIIGLQLRWKRSRTQNISVTFCFFRKGTNDCLIHFSLLALLDQLLVLTWATPKIRQGHSWNHHAFRSCAVNIVSNLFGQKLLLGFLCVKCVLNLPPNTLYTSLKFYLRPNHFLPFPHHDLHPRHSHLFTWTTAKLIA